MRGLLLLPLCAVALGCGGGGSDRLSQEDFERQANEICVDLNRAFDAMGEADTPAELQTQLEEGERELTSALAELRELRPPEDAQEEFDRFLAAGEQLTGLVRDLKDAAATQNVARLEQIATEAEQVGERADRDAAAIGLDECAAD